MKTVCITLLSLISSVAGANTDVLFDEVPHNLYMDTLSECEECISYTIIISDEDVDKSIATSFREIAESFGQKHAGAIVSWGDALASYRFFKNQGCGPFNDLADKVVTFIDKSSAFCKHFPYEDQTQLIALISIISSNIDDLGNLQNETWRLQTKQAIEIYAKENAIVDSLKQLAYELVDYVVETFVEYRKQGNL